jgi:hypothetical protein
MLESALITLFQLSLFTYPQILSHSEILGVTTSVYEFQGCKIRPITYFSSAYYIIISYQYVSIFCINIKQNICYTVILSVIHFKHYIPHISTYIKYSDICMCMCVR